MSVEVPNPEWDAWLDHAGPEADFVQTARWAAIDEAANGRRCRVVRSGEQAGALVSLPRARGEESVCFYGPVFVNTFALAALPGILDEAEMLAREADASVMRFVGRPPRSAIPVAEVRRSFLTAGYEAVDWWSAIVDLQVTEEMLLSRCDRAVRKALKRCEREGVRVRRCTDTESFERDFLQPYATAKPSDYDPQRDRIAFRIDAGRDYNYFVAVASDGEILATLGTHRYDRLAREIMSVRTAVGKERGLPGQDLLHWEVLRHHQVLGDEAFDLAGYSPEPRNDAEAGIRRFKLKWGGIPVPSPIFVKPLGSRIGRAVGRLRNALA